MQLPNNALAGVAAFAVMNRLIDAMIERGLFNRTDIREVLEKAAYDLQHDPRGSNKQAGDFLVGEAKNY